MFGITVIIFLASAVEGQYHWQASQAKQGNRQIPNAMRTPQARLNQASLQGVASARLPFAAPTERFQAFATNAVEAEETAAVAVAEAEGDSSTGTAVAEPPASGAQNALNIFGEPTQECADGKVAAFAKDTHCAYESFSPKLCVDVPPLKEAVLGVKRIGAIGPRCVSVWDLETQPITSEKAGQFQVNGVTMMCGALPLDVLTSEYTNSEWNNCEMYQKSYDSLFRPGFLYYGKWPADPVTSKMNKMTRHCRRFRKAINAICNDCADQAPNGGAKAALQAKCAAYSKLDAETADAELFDHSDDSSSRPTATNCALLGALVGTAFAFARGIRQQRELERTGQEYLLMA